MRKVIGTLVVLLAIVIGLGLYLGWFSFATKRSAQDDQKVTLSVEVDKEKIKEDAEAAQKKAKEIGEKIKNKTDISTREETATGKIAKVDASAGSILVTTADNKDVTIRLETSTQIRLKDADMQLKGLRDGDHVTVVYTVKNGNNVARSVTVKRTT